MLGLSKSKPAKADLWSAQLRATDLKVSSRQSCSSSASSKSFKCVSIKVRVGCLASSVLDPNAFRARRLDALLVVARPTVGALPDVVQLEREEGLGGVAALAQEPSRLAKLELRKGAFN